MKLFKTALVTWIIALAFLFSFSSKALFAQPISFSIPYKQVALKEYPESTKYKGECAWFVQQCRPDIMVPNPETGETVYGVAKNIFLQARERGFATDNKPRVGAIIVWGENFAEGTGHAGIVKEIKDDGTIVVIDSNLKFDHKIRETDYKKDEYEKQLKDRKILGFVYEKKEIYELKKKQAGELLVTNVAKSVIAKKAGNEIPALFLMSQLEMKTAMTTPAFLAPRIDTSTDTAQTQNTIGVENDPPWNMSGRPTSHWGFMICMLTQDPAGSGIYGKGYDSGNNLSNLDSSNIRAFDKDGWVMTLDGTSSPPRITSLQTPTGTATGGIPVSVNMNELGHNSFMEWGYWLQNNFMQAGGANYYFENSYYVRGDYTTNAQMQALNISGKYNGNAYATYWAAPGGPLNKADMSGNFSADVNFSSKTLSNINISVSGNSHSASISGATASFTGGSSTFVGNSDGHWKIDGVTAGSGTKKKLKGSFYGPNAKAIGGLFGMNTLTTPTKYVTGAFQGSR